MSDKKLGVLGGMGPLATAIFFERLVNKTKSDRDQDHIDTVIMNHASLPDRTEAILNNNSQPFLSKIEEDIRLLEIANVSNIVIPCNTSHYFLEEMQAMTNINIVNMIGETIKSIKQMNHSRNKVAILATDGTIQSRVYENECKNHDLDYYIPNNVIQDRVMNIIYQIKSGHTGEVNDLSTIINELITNEKCTAIILGCTELSCVDLKQNIKKYCIDPMEILVHKAISLSGKEININ